MMKMTTTYKNGEKIATVAKESNSYLFIMTRGIIGEYGVDGDMQVFDLKGYRTEAGATKSALAWIN
jgi:hypothetical protein